MEKNIDDDAKSDGREEDELSVTESYLFKFKVKNHGYAWVPVCGMIVSNALTAGYILSFGIIFKAIQELNPDISVTMAGVMMSLLIGCRCMFSPAAGALGNILGIRLTMFLGAALCFAALVIAFFCSSVVGYVITLGAMSGIGHCMMEACHVITLSNYFDRKLPFANGMRVAGSSFGGVVYPPMVAFLLEFYGARLLFLMLGAIMLHLFICAAITRPISVHFKIRSLNYVDSYFKNNDPETLMELNPKLSESQNKFENLKKQKQILYQKLISLNPIPKGKKKPLDFTYLRNPVYSLFLLMAAGIPMALPLIKYYMTIYATTVVGLSVYEISLILSLQSIFDICMRLIMGYLNSKKLYTLAHGYIFCLMVSGFSCFLMPFTTGIYTILLVNIACSLGGNSYHTFVNVILADQFGSDSIATTYGFVRVSQGIFSFIHPVLIGYVVEVTGSFTIPFFIMGSGLLFSCLMMMIEPLVIKATKSKVIIS